MNEAAVEIANLTKDFPVGLRGRKLRAVEDLSLKVPDNEIFGLLGPNGSGKSTTIKILLGLLPASQGECRLFGEPSHLAAARRNVGYLPEAPYFYRYLTGHELVTFYAGICGLRGSARKKAVESAIERVDMTEAAGRRVGSYSKGMLQRIGLAQAIVHGPRLVVLDEPTAGVDPIGAAAIGEIILDLKRQGKTVLVCSHLLSQLEDLCDRVAILHKGRLVVEGKVDDLLSGGKSGCMLVEGLDVEGCSAIQDAVTARGGRCSVDAGAGRSLESIFLEAVQPAVSEKGGEAS